MSIVPESIAESITFFENNLTAWASNAAAIGIEPTQATQIAGLTVQARSAFNAARAARVAARSATQIQAEAVEAMRTYGGDLIKTIKAFAETTDDPSVLSKAQLPTPKPRTPLGPAPTPERLTANLTNAGELSLSWEAEARGRLAFVVERRVAQPGQAFGGWTLIGTSTSKSFIDAGLPTGLESAQYRVFAERPGGRSQPTEPIVVLFGTGGQASGGELRIAA